MLTPQQIKTLTTRFEALNDKQKKEFAIEVKEDLIQHFTDWGKRVAADPNAAFKSLLQQFGDAKLIEKGLQYAKPQDKTSDEDSPLFR